VASKIGLRSTSKSRILISQMTRFAANENKLNDNVNFPFSFEFDQNYLTEELQKKEKSGYIIDYYDSQVNSFDKYESIASQQKKMFN
jgi:hypothetical protein